MNYLTALREHQAGNIERAEKMYHEILAAEPNNAEVMHLLSILLAQQQNFIAAQFFMEQALVVDPKSPSFHNSMGNILKNLKQYNGAIYHYNEALRIQPDYAIAHNSIGNIFYSIGEFEKAAHSYRKAIRLKPDYADAHYNLSLIMKRQDQDADAIAHLQTTLDWQPRHAEAHYQLASLFQAQNNLEQAARHYQLALRINPNDVAAHHNLGVVLVAKNKHVAAIRHFKAVLRMQPNHLEALHNLGAVFLLEKNPAAALKYFLRITQVQRDFDAYYNLGVIYMDLGRYKDAITYFDEALKMQPNDFASCNNLGAIYLRCEDLNNAELYYRRALLLQPHNEEVKYILAAISQENAPVIAPKEYVQNLFDQYAPNFEQHLKLLNYRAPEILAEEVIAIFSDAKKDLAIVDLGCGTGLCGEKISSLAKKMVGVDLSEKMLAVAAEKNIYTELINADFEIALFDLQHIDLIVAADSLVYCGDLAVVFDMCKKALKKQGVFAFTLEKTTSYPFVLQRSARFAHNAKYIEELAAKNEFVILQKKEIILRKQKDTLIEGYLYLLRAS